MSDPNYQGRILPRPPIGMFYEPAGCTIPAGPPVNYGIVGCGPRGREIIAELAKLPNAPVVALCDHFPPTMRRAGELAPEAAKFEDYRQLLDRPEVQAVVVATPTHQHRAIVEAALQAGKHVYCEAPLASTVEDARAIAIAARAAGKVVFQSGLQLRRNPHRRVQSTILRGGGLGKPFLARAQWNRKKSWAVPASEPEREAELNWRLKRETSLGLAGEIAIHQLDLFCWFLHAQPTAVSGIGSLIEWDADGREVADTIHLSVEFPDHVHLIYDATQASSFDGGCEFLQGSHGTLMMRGNRAWLFKEDDAPLTAWEDWARREYFFGQLGLALRVGSLENAYPNPPLYYALEAFTARAGASNPDPSLKLDLAPGWKEGFEATVLGIKANEAVVKRERIVLGREFLI